jgi:hypothetical protein
MDISIAFKVFMTAGIFLIPSYGCWLWPNKEVAKVGLFLVLLCASVMLGSMLWSVWSQ